VERDAPKIAHRNLIKDFSLDEARYARRHKQRHQYWRLIEPPRALICWVFNA
jgi:hypothetical protein